MSLAVDTFRFRNPSLAMEAKIHKTDWDRDVGALSAPTVAHQSGKVFDGATNQAGYSMIEDATAPHVASGVALNVRTELTQKTPQPTFWKMARLGAEDYEQRRQRQAH